MGHGRASEEAALLQNADEWDPEATSDAEGIDSESERQPWGMRLHPEQPRGVMLHPRCLNPACWLPVGLLVGFATCRLFGAEAAGEAGSTVDAGGHEGHHDRVTSQGMVTLDGHHEDHHHEDCHTARRGERCFKAITWAKTQGIFSNPDWYPGLTNLSSLGEFQVAVHTATKEKCPAPCVGGNPGDKPCLPLHVPDRYGICAPAREPVRMTFYMYRAQGDDEYDVANLNLGSLAGVMWYLHHEVVGSRPRKFHIKRIIRYKVTMKTTKDWFQHSTRQFGPFVAFDAGSARQHGNEEHWRDYGFVVGCQLMESGSLKYVPPPEEQPGCHPKDSPLCRSGKWYSLPGACPTEKTDDKSPPCIADWPGGKCPSAVVTGEHDCTYWPEFAGQIQLDELEGIDNYDKWWLTKNSRGGVVPNKNVEYSKHLDRGVGMTFWDRGSDEHACAGRMEAVRKLFKEKFPQHPETLPEPPCM